MMVKDNRGRCIPGCSTYDPRARIRPARRFHPARETYEAYWHSTPWWVRWINSCQTDWWFPAKIDDFKKNTLTPWSCWVIRFKFIPLLVPNETHWQSEWQWLKKAFSEEDLLSFDSGYVSSDSYPSLARDAKNFTDLFGSSRCYQTEQLFSRMKNTKTKSRSTLKDGHLTTSLRISTSAAGADIDCLCKHKQCQISH